VRVFLLSLLLLVAFSYFTLERSGKRFGDGFPIAIDQQAAADLQQQMIPGAFTGLQQHNTSAPQQAVPHQTPGAKGSSSPAVFAESGEAGSPVENPIGPHERIGALKRLADFNQNRLFDVLWQALNEAESGDSYFQEFLLETIETHVDFTPGEVLALLVRNAPGPEARRSALDLIAEASQELSMGPFNQALEQPDPELRHLAESFFDDLSADAMLEAVAEAVTDSNRDVRRLALSTLEEMHSFAPIWDVAATVLDDPDPGIRMRALELLTYGERQAAIDHLALAIDDPHPGVSGLADALLIELEQGPS
jgi:hypothetical protein